MAAGLRDYCSVENREDRVEWTCGGGIGGETRTKRKSGVGMC